MVQWGLWPLSNLEISSNELSRLIRKTPNPTIPDSRYRLNSTAPRIDSKLVSITEEPSDQIAKNSSKADDRRLEPAADVDYPNSVSEGETDKRSAAVKAAIDAVESESVRSWEYVEGLRAATEIIGAGRQKGFSHEQVKNLIETGQLDNYGKGGRYDKFKFLRSDLDRLADPENRKKPGRKIGWKKV